MISTTSSHTNQGPRTERRSGPRSRPGDSNSKALAGKGKGEMPFQTHHLQHVRQKQTTLGPKGLSATHFPKMLLSRLGGVCFTCIAQTLVHVAVSTHWTFWAIRHATPLCNESHTHQESEHATFNARIEKLSTRAIPRRWARDTKLPKRTPCRWSDEGY